MKKSSMEPAGLCSAPLHMQQPVASAVECARQDSALQSSLMKLFMALSAVTEEKWAAAVLS